MVEQGIRRFPARQVRHEITAVLSAWGMADDLVEMTADAMVDTDLAGIDSHGIAMLPSYERMHTAGHLDPQARPYVVSETATTGLINGAGGFGHPSATLGMQLAINKADTTGVGIVTARESRHFGAAGHYATMAAHAGLIGLVTSSARLMSVPPTRGAAPMLGTNPLAFAAPTKTNHPFVLDMSTSTVASNKIRLYELNDWPLPPGWVTDSCGASVVSAEHARQQMLRGEGGMTPLGATADMSSHKGYGLALMVQILAATLSGAEFAPIHRAQPDRPSNIGHFLLALDPAAFRPHGAFQSDLDAMIDLLHSTPPADPDLPVLVAGEPEAKARAERSQIGIPIPQSLLKELHDVCRRSNVPFSLC